MSSDVEARVPPVPRTPAPGQTNDGLRQAEAAMFAASSGYERYMGRWSRLIAPRLLEFAGARDGQRVLDVGTGTGALAHAAAAALGTSEVVGVDPSAAFIEHARTLARTPRLRFEVGDARSLPFASHSFDQVLALLVMNFIPDHVRAVGEMRRVTRPGGVVSAGVWDYDRGMQMLRAFWDEVIAQDPTMAPRDERHMKLAREGQLGALWTSAGLVDVCEEPVVIEQRFESFGDYWGAFLEGAGPGGAYVVSLQLDARHELEARLRRRLLGDGPGRPFTLSARAWCVRGRVPEAG